LPIFATSLADAAPLRGTRCADRYDAEASRAGNIGSDLGMTTEILNRIS
jgi:hypothetical protein